MDGWNDGWMDRWTDGMMDGWIDGWIDVVFEVVSFFLIIRIMEFLQQTNILFSYLWQRYIHI